MLLEHLQPTTLKGLAADHFLLLFLAHSCFDEDPYCYSAAAAAAAGNDDDDEEEDDVDCDDNDDDDDGGDDEP